MSLSPAALESFAASILNNEEALLEVRDRFQMKMLQKFRMAPPAEREQINAIMDNEKMFFDELKAILGAAEVVNDTVEESPND